MRYARLSGTTFIFLILLYLIFPQDAYGYLDLGSGSYILQLIAGVLLGGLFSIKLFWHKIKAKFKNSSPGENDGKCEK
ncbi:MAG: hypothetical protein PHI59_00505 [Candidatus Omnitrophica bacterium]|nr:hypothetical protein [Candidatus Omnitrophota bacterium]